jgi:ATP-dependent DNA helicase RecQ
MLEQSENQGFSDVMQGKLNKMKAFCQSKTCRRKYLLNYFGEEAADNCGNCDTCFQKGNLQDMTIPSQMLLSTIARLSEAFGLGYVVLVLRGSKSAKIQEAHQALSVYGIGKDRPESFWKDLGEKLQQEGYLAEAGSQFPTLKLTTLAWEKLKSKEKFLLPMEEERPTASPTSAKHDEGLLDELKVLRHRLAQKDNVPPYVVFADNTLVEMATYFPTDEDALLTISGVGKIKANSYGRDFLGLVKKYAKDHQLEPIQKARQRKTPVGKDSQSEMLTLKYHEEGMNIFQIAQARSMTPTTIESHIANLVKRQLIDLEKFLSKDDVLNIRLAYRRQGNSFLKPLKEHFGDRYSYFQLKVALADEREG